MKKLLLITTFLFAYNSDAANLVPVVSGVSPELQAEVYHRITNSGFVYLLDPNKRAALSPDEITQVIEDERAFVTKKIHDVCPGAKVTFIPKSLYQLSMLQLMFTQATASNPATEGGSMDTSLVLRTYLRWFFPTGSNGDISIGFGAPVNPRTIFGGYVHICAPEKEEEVEKAVSEISRTHVSLGTRSKGEKKSPTEMQENTFLGLCSSISEYHENPSVQEAFWEINSNILATISGELNRDSIKESTQRLIESICANAKKLEDFLKKNSENNVICEYLKVDFEKIPHNALSAMSPFIGGLIIREFEAPQGTYRLYRSEGKAAANKRFDNAYSFSDGLFGGLIRDGIDGAAFGCLVNRNKWCEGIICADLPTKDLLEGKLPIIIPPVNPMGSALGDGEVHHPRVKRLIRDLDDEAHVFARERGWTINSEIWLEEFEDLSSVPQSYLTENKQELMDFWKNFDSKNWISKKVDEEWQWRPAKVGESIWGNFGCRHGFIVREFTYSPQSK